MLFALPAFADGGNVTVTVNIDDACYLWVDTTPLVFNAYTVDADGYHFANKYVPYKLYTNHACTVAAEFDEVTWDDELYISFAAETDYPDPGVYLTDKLTVSLSGDWSLLPGEYTGTIIITQI